MYKTLCNNGHPLETAYQLLTSFVSSTRLERSECSLPSSEYKWYMAKNLHEYFQNEVLMVEYEDNYMSIIANSLRCDYHNGECIMYQPYGASDEFTELMNKNK